MKILYRILVTFIFVFAVDGVTKVWAEQSLVPYQPVPIVDDIFRLTLGYNTGVAFGMFSNGGIWPLVVTGVIIVGLVIWFFQALYSGHFPPHTAWPVGMLLGGALGNFVDRWPDGRVTDFLDVGWGAWRWPTFNLADSFILIGVTMLVLFTFNHQSETESQYNQASAENKPDSLLS